MANLAGQIEADIEQFSVDADGDIDTSNLISVSRMSVQFLGRADSPDNYISEKVHPSTEFFSDFDAMGRSVESANIGLVKETEKIAELQAEKEEKKAEQQRDAVIDLIAVIQSDLQPEDYELQTWNINGQDWQVSNAGLEATLHRIRTDLDGFMNESGLSDDKREIVENLEEELRGKSESEQQSILERLAEKNPDVFNAFMKETGKNSLELSEQHELTTEQPSNEQAAQDLSDKATSSDALFGNSFEMPSDNTSSFATTLSENSQHAPLAQTFTTAANDDLFSDKGISITPELENSGVQHVHVDVSHEFTV